MWRKLNLPVALAVITVSVLAVLWWRNNQRLDEFVASPEIGDIYILQNGETYHPMKVVYISPPEQKEISFVQYIFSFGEAVPDRELLLDEEWDLNYIAHYKTKEISRLYDEGKIVEIYRD